MSSEKTSPPISCPSSGKKPVILQIIPHLGAGGAEQGCLDVAAEIVRCGATSLVASHGGPRVPELIRAGSKHFLLPVHSKNPFVLWQNIDRIRKIILENEVDIVHVRSRAPAWSALQAVKGTSAHFMTTCHAPFNLGGRLKRFYNSSIVRGERVIAISEYVRTYLIENYTIDPSVIRVIPRGIALEKFHPSIVTWSQIVKLNEEWRLPDCCQIVLMPGRLTRWKGHLVLIEAMAKLERDDLYCVMIGDDQGRLEYRKELEDTIEKSGMAGRIRLVGHCRDMAAAYALATLVVSASTDPEGFGRVPVEAQAMGCPVIATAHGGAMETIRPEETGFLVPPADPDALATCIERILSLDAQQKVLMATRAMTHVAENFTREGMCARTLSVYNELLCGHK